MVLVIFDRGGSDCKADICTFIGLMNLGAFPNLGNSSSSGSGSPAIRHWVGRGRRTRAGRAGQRSHSGSAAAASTVARRGPTVRTGY
jgi:hypothetical protein